MSTETPLPLLFPEIRGTSEITMELRARVASLARSHRSVLIVGATGTGKEVVARALHAGSPRREGPFEAHSCATTAAGDVGLAALFGTEEGAFTGAQEKAGVVELAEGGTLFLDEIDRMDTPQQSRLLRAIEAKEVRRVGGQKDIPVDFRLVAATSTNLEAAMAEGAFLPDLFHRIGQNLISIPRLADRPDDIEDLVRGFLTEPAEKKGLGRLGLSPKSLALLRQQPWTGNVRELRNLLEGLLDEVERGERRPRDGRLTDRQVRAAIEGLSMSPAFPKVEAPGERRSTALSGPETALLVRLTALGDPTSFEDVHSMVLANPELGALDHPERMATMVQLANRFEDKTWTYHALWALLVLEHYRVHPSDKANRVHDRLKQLGLRSSSYAYFRRETAKRWGGLTVSQQRALASSLQWGGASDEIPRRASEPALDLSPPEHPTPRRISWKAVMTVLAVAAAGLLLWWRAPSPELSPGDQRVAVGRDHACFIVQGEIQCWYGPSHPCFGVGSPGAPRSLGESAEAVAASGHRTCASTESGQLWCWGEHRAHCAPRPIEDGPVGRLVGGGFGHCVERSSSKEVLCLGPNGGERDRSPSKAKHLVSLEEGWCREESRQLICRFGDHEVSHPLKEVSSVWVGAGDLLCRLKKDRRVDCLTVGADGLEPRVAAVAFPVEDVRVGLPCDEESCREKVCLVEEGPGHTVWCWQRDLENSWPTSLSFEPVPEAWPTALSIGGTAECALLDEQPYCWLAPKGFPGGMETRSVDDAY